MVRILITAGPTREHLDDVRFLANGSSGRMGYALAEAALAVGAQVDLVSGPVSIEPPPGAHRISVTSAAEMLAAAEIAHSSADLAFFVAAVCDYRPAARVTGKPAKTPGPTTLDLVPNPDIAATLGRSKGPRVHLGFALEAGAGDAALEKAMARGRQKLEAKGLDLIAINLTEAMDGTRSRVVLLDGGGRRTDIGERDKAETAVVLVEAALSLWRARRGETHD